MSLISETRQTDDIFMLIEPALTAMGLEIVRVRITGRDELVLQIMLECTDGGQIDVDDCSNASRTISALLDVEDPFPGHYDLEVSSPGIDRPLTRRKDFERYAGFEARIELAKAKDGKRRYRGRIKGMARDDVQLEADGADVSLPLDSIIKAKLVLTDELIERMTPS